MDGKKICINKDDQLCSKEYLEVLNHNQEIVNIPNKSNSHWWTNDNEEEKLDIRKRWSFGSDTSNEPVERVQNRLCCSPVDDYDSPVNSENEDLIVNSLDESDEIYNKYIPSSPQSCSPTFEKVNYNSDKKKSSKNHDVDTADDELIDYSKIYVTEKEYAETDLDQPTDYSLRYPDEEDKKDSQFYCTNLQDDTVKTYHTEGTPHNFSNATSMTDLLSLEDSKGNYEPSYKFQISKEQKQNKIEKTSKEYKKGMQKESIIEDSKIQDMRGTKEVKNEKSGRRFEKLMSSPQSPPKLCIKDKENKVAISNNEEAHAQETPLMFSRCSSLDSLNDFDQHSIHDDQSSVISDFSHRTSGAVSPSDLPDSPTQTVPPSPTKYKCRNDQQQLHQKTAASYRKIQGNKHSLQTPEPSCKDPNENDQCGDFFEDTLVTFRKESLTSSKAHSTNGSILSSLTIDDDDGSIYNCDNRDIIDRIAAIRVRTSAAGMHQAPTQKLLCNRVLNDPDKSIRHTHQNKVLNKQSGRTFDSLVLPHSRDQIDHVNFEDKNSHKLNFDSKDTHVRCKNLSKDQWYEHDLRNENYNQSNKIFPMTPMYKRNEINYVHKMNNEEPIITDTVRIYRTENTPTYSPYSSQSNLSALSALSFSDDDSNFQDQQRFVYEKRTNSHENPFDSNPNSDSSDNDYSYEEDTPHLHRIDVSPFDSQLNLANLSLLCIEEEDEDEEEEKEEEEEEGTNYETDNSKKDDSYADDENENCDFSEAERKVFEECVNSGVSKLTRRLLHADADNK